MHDTAPRGFNSFTVGAGLTAIGLAALVNWTSLLRRWAVRRGWDRSVLAQLLGVRAPRHRLELLSSKSPAQREAQ